MSAIDISADVALVALFLLTCNILLGLLISTRYSPLTNWPHRRINIFQLHNWTGYTALCIAALHPLILVFSKSAGFHFKDILFPLHSPTQPFENCLGALAFYCLSVVVVTSYFRVQLGRRTWKRLHYTAYAAAILFFTHGLLADPNLKNAKLDPIDAEKVFVEVCILIVAGAVLARARYALRKRRLSPPSRT